MKIALVHDYLNEAGGAERVLRVLAEMYLTAPIYTAFAKNGTAKALLGDRMVIESKWGWLLKVGRTYSYGRFLLPWVWKSVDLTKYDLIITSCSGYIARGFRVRDDARVVAYCHTPPRWLYGYETPTGAQKKWWGAAFMWGMGPFMRYFDYQSAQRVNTWIANSNEVAGRIEKFYRKKATVVYPPCVIQETGIRKQELGTKDYYLVVSRIVGGKGIEEAVKGAQKAGIKLKIVGENVSNQYAVHSTRGVEYLGRVNDNELAKLYAGAKGFIALAHDEDFGMTVVEAMSYGTPVLAYNGGGYRETVIDNNQSPSTNIQTGILINNTDALSVAAGIKKMEKTKWERERIIKWAKRFDRVQFEKGIRGIVGA